MPIPGYAGGLREKRSKGFGAFSRNPLIRLRASRSRSKSGLPHSLFWEKAMGAERQVIEHLESSDPRTGNHSAIRT